LAEIGRERPLRSGAKDNCSALTPDVSHFWIGGIIVLDLKRRPLKVYPDDNSNEFT